MSQWQFISLVKQCTRKYQSRPAFFISWCFSFLSFFLFFSNCFQVLKFNYIIILQIIQNSYRDFCQPESIVHAVQNCFVFGLNLPTEHFVFMSKCQETSQLFLKSLFKVEYSRTCIKRHRFKRSPYIKRSQSPFAKSQRDFFYCLDLY